MPVIFSKCRLYLASVLMGNPFPGALWVLVLGDGVNLFGSSTVRCIPPLGVRTVVVSDRSVSSIMENLSRIFSTTRYFMSGFPVRSLGGSRSKTQMLLPGVM